MAKAKTEIDWKAASAACMELCAKAREEGRHSSDASDWCQLCGLKVPAIYHVTIDGKRICILCAARSSIRGAEDDLKKWEPALFAQLQAERKAASAAAMIR